VTEDNKNEQVAVAVNDIKWIMYELKEMKAETKIILNDIDAQVRLTNGRVSNLEKWRDRLTGTWAGITSIVAIIVSIVTGIILAGLKAWLGV